MQLIGAIRSTTEPLDRLRLIARWSRGTYERGIADIELLIDEAARSSPEASAIAERAAAQRYEFTRLVVDVVSEVVPDVEPARLDQIAQFIWAVDSSPVYRMLVRGQGWTNDRFEEWVYGFYCSLLPIDG